MGNTGKNWELGLDSARNARLRQACCLAEAEEPI
eukprot:COSAG05_NODE_502_length_9214_cov_3.816676_5_plen_34_part_00